ncbi:transposase [Sphingomonas sp. AX6]|uniref:transposase n=1 Tax=Sphingomonas sp. AX6 TaxID=2653171 RepID=UPI00135B90DC|nr:transposase [Sphingomonas sp. AX6]
MTLGAAPQRRDGVFDPGHICTTSGHHRSTRCCDDPPSALETIAAFDRRFPTDEHCLERLFQVRFGGGFDCPRCRRSTNWHRIRAERAYSCQWCGNHLHPTVGTPLENSRIPLRLWFYAIRQPESACSKMLVRQMTSAFGVAPATAQRIVRRIRDASIDWADILLSSHGPEPSAPTRRSSDAKPHPLQPDRMGSGLPLAWR